MKEASNHHPRSEKDIFFDAIEIEDPAGREAFLKDACSGDAALLTAVKALLDHNQDDAFMQTALVATTTEDLNHSGILSSDLAGEKISDRSGVYKILQQIGEGGAGIVYLAEQEEPVRRRVAIKVLKPGLETKSVIARFESESQALALMDHPNIARVLDAGSTQSGRPFFVMDLVRGTRITDYCDKNQLSTGERLSIFIQVCHAVQHAHQKGVIHRDIKPSNVLVTLHDGKPVPKVIDFGIAKATEQKLTDLTVLTEFHSFMGTPAYVSPEQAEMSGLDIDTRADIYSLGVLLYELLTGKTPFDPDKLIASGLDGMRRTIRESEPMKPSTRIRTMLDADRTTTATHQRLEPSKLSSLLQGDLDWIILKALEKDRTRRYETANALAMDVGRYLQNLPVLARPPSATYRLQKFIRRNKLATTTFIAFTAALAIGLSFTTWQWIEKSEAYLQLEESERIEKGLREQATKARKVAETQSLINRRRAYASDMNLAQQALASNNLGRARELLERYIPDNSATSQQENSLDLRGWEWRLLWEQCRSDALFDLGKAPNGVVSLNISHDGLWVAMRGEWNDQISIWDLRSREQIIQFSQSAYSSPFKISPTAPILAFTTRDSDNANRQQNSSSVLQLWDREKREIVAKLPLSGNCSAMAFSSDGAILRTVTDNLTVTDWDVNLGVPLESKQLNNKPIPFGRFGFGSTALSDNLRFLAYDLGEGKVSVLDLSNGKTLWESRVVDERITELALSPDGTLLATSGGFVESSVKLWDVSSGIEIARLDGHRTYIQSLVFWPDGKKLASASGDQTVRVWDISKLSGLRQSAADFVSRGRPWRPWIITQSEATFKGHKDEVWSLALSPTTGTLVSGSKDGLVSVWDTNSHSTEHGPLTLQAEVEDWSFSPDGLSMVTYDEAGQITRWSGDQFQDHTVMIEFEETIERVHFSRNGEVLAANNSNEMIEIWDLGDRQHQLTIGSVEEPEIPVAFVGPDNNLVSLRVGMGEYRQWDIKNGTIVKKWNVPAPQSRSSIIHSPSGQWSLQLYGDQAGHLRNSVTGLQTNLDIGVQQVSRGAFSPDDRYVAIVSALGVAHVWNTEDKNLVATIRGFLQGQHSVAFSPDSSRMAIASNAREAVKLWDTHGFHELLTLEGTGSLFMSVGFSPDGNSLAACNWDGLLHIWKVPALSEISSFQGK